MTAFIYPVSWLLGLILAPSTLALLGNLAGELKWSLLAALVAAFAAFWLNAASLARLTHRTGNPADAIDALSDTFGNAPAAALFFSGRLITTLAASTVMLVTAGFVFNETIVYWFPNFAFAFGLLGVVLGFHLFGQATVQRFQMICVGLVLAGLCVLTVIGLISESPPQVQADTATAAAFRPLIAVMLLFVGFDLAANHKGAEPGAVYRPMMAGLIAAAAAMAVWSAVSIQYVPAQKLADTFIAHTLAAKAVAGQTGRVVMAIVIIAGAGAAVNALIWNLSNSSSQWISRLKGPGAGASWRRHPATGSLISGAVIAAMMALGMAGTDEIDFYVRAGLYLWMVYYAAIHLAVLLRHLKADGPVSLQGRIPAVLGLILMIGATTVLIFTDPEKAVVVKAAVAIPLLLALGWLAGRGRHDSGVGRVTTQ